MFFEKIQSMTRPHSQKCSVQVTRPTNHSKWKSPDLPVGWSTLLPLGSPFWILAGTCQMVHRRWTQMIKDGQCLQIKVFSCNIRYEICKKWRSWLVPSFNCKRRINSKGIYIKCFIKMLYLSYPRHHLFLGLHLLLLLQDLTQFERLSQNLQVLTDWKCLSFLICDVFLFCLHSTYKMYVNYP